MRPDGKDRDRDPAAALGHGTPPAALALSRARGRAGSPWGDVDAAGVQRVVSEITAAGGHGARGQPLGT